jgi:ABC-type branched-subunit amino acid transport system ATPase component
MHLLQAATLSSYYGSIQDFALCAPSLTAGEISVLEAPNGSGRSTLLLCFSALLLPILDGNKEKRVIIP